MAPPISEDDEGRSTGKRIILILQIAVLACLVFLAFLFMFPINLESYKGSITSAVHNATGREATIRGAMSLRLGVTPTIIIEDISLANASWARRKKMVEVERITVDLALWPLLGREVEIQDIRVDGTTVSLSTNRAGKASWEFTTLQSEDATSASAGFQLNHIDRIHFSNTTIQFWPGEDRDLTTLFLSEITIANPKILQLAAQLDKNDTLTDYGIVDQITAKQGRFSVFKSKESQEQYADIERVTLTPGKQNIQTVLDLRVEGHPLLLEALLTRDAPGLEVEISTLETPYGTLDGTVTTPDLSQEPLQITAKLNSQKITIAKGKGSADNTLWQDLPVPSERWLPVNLDLTLLSESVVASDITLAKFALRGKTAGSVLTITEFSTELADGIVTLSGAYDIGKSPATLEMDAVLKDISLDRLKELAGESGSAHGGQLYGELFLDSTGRTFRKLRSNATLGGPVYGENLSYPIAEISNKKLVQALAGDSNAESIKVGCLVADLHFTDPKFEVKEYAFDTQGAIVTGEAQYNFSKKHVNVLMQPKSKVLGLSDLVVTPFRISGPLDDISVYPDPKGLAKNVGITALGSATGVGLLGVLGLKVLDKLDIAARGGPCKKPLNALPAEPATEEMPETLPAPEAPIEETEPLSSPEAPEKTGEPENLREGEPADLTEGEPESLPETAPAATPEAPATNHGDEPAETVPAPSSETPKADAAPEANDTSSEEKTDIPVKTAAEPADTKETDVKKMPLDESSPELFFMPDTESAGPDGEPESITPVDMPPTIEDGNVATPSPTP